MNVLVAYQKEADGKALTVVRALSAAGFTVTTTARRGDINETRRRALEIAHEYDLLVCIETPKR